MFPAVHKIDPAGGLHLISFGLLLPLLAVSQARKFAKADKPLPNRTQHFQTTALTLLLFGAFSLSVARLEWMDLFPRALPPWRAIVAGVLMFAIATAVMRPRWRRAVERGARVVHLFMPATASERAWWIVVAILAGISEEITWRGVQMGLAYRVFGNAGIAVLLCAISFGLGHIIQGWKSATGISIFALAFHLLVWLSGSLYVAMAAHVAYDIAAGVSYGRLGRDLGYRPDAKTDSPTVASAMALRLHE